MTVSIELPDALFAQAQSAAAQRGTTLKGVIKRALERELFVDIPPAPNKNAFTVDEQGLPLFHRQGDAVVTSERVYRMMEDLGV